MARRIPEMIVVTITSQPLETDVQENLNATPPDRALNNLSTAVGAQMKHGASAGTLKTRSLGFGLPSSCCGFRRDDGETCQAGEYGGG
ncbi:hypothetical protein SISSUDRAFT_1055805, partial [Sistotremastrum suecicum HHB10207 ss-3]